MYYPVWCWRVAVLPLCGVDAVLEGRSMHYPVWCWRVAVCITLCGVGIVLEGCSATVCARNAASFAVCSSQAHCLDLNG
jgi:hypothetical protein